VFFFSFSVSRGRFLVFFAPFPEEEISDYYSSSYGRRLGVLATFFAQSHLVAWHIAQPKTPVVPCSSSWALIRTGTKIPVRPVCSFRHFRPPGPYPKTDELDGWVHWLMGEVACESSDNVGSVISSSSALSQLLSARHKGRNTLRWLWYL